MLAIRESISKCECRGFCRCECAETRGVIPVFAGFRRTGAGIGGCRSPRSSGRLCGRCCDRDALVRIARDPAFVGRWALGDCQPLLVDDHSQRLELVPDRSALAGAFRQVDHQQDVEAPARLHWHGNSEVPDP